MTKRVIAYRRISTDEGRQRHSLDHQKDLCEKYCSALNYNIVLDIAEEYSAKNFKRPKWQFVKEYIKKNKGKIDAIVFTKWDSFGRSSEYALTEIRMLEKMGVIVICVEQPLDLTNPTDKFMLKVYLGMGEAENDTNCQRTTEGSRKARQKGLWTGTAPLGYKNYRDELDRSTLRPDENASLVQEIFHKMSTGIYCADTLRKEYVAKGIKLPCKQPFLDMLRNITYIGLIAVKKYKDKPYEEVQGLHPPIVDSDIFFKVQKVLKQRSKARNLVLMPKENIYPLKGALVCPELEHHMVAYKTTKPNGKEYHYYECQLCKIRHRVNVIEEEFIKYLNQFRIKEEILNLYLKIAEEILSREDSSIKSEIKNMEEKIKECDTLLNKLTYKYAKDEIDITGYKEMRAMIERDKGDLVMKLTERTMDKTPVRSYIKWLAKLLPNMGMFYKQASNDLKTRMVSSIFPEKLIFQYGQYRTAKPNSLISIISMNINDLKGEKTKMAGNISGQSCSAPPSRLERETP